MNIHIAIHGGLVNVKYFGMVICIPRSMYEANWWIATDDDGSIYTYEKEPMRTKNSYVTSNECSNSWHASDALMYQFMHFKTDTDLAHMCVQLATLELVDES